MAKNEIRNVIFRYQMSVFNTSNNEVFHEGQHFSGNSNVFESPTFSSPLSSPPLPSRQQFGNKVY